MEIGAVRGNETTTFRTFQDWSVLCTHLSEMRCWPLEGWRFPARWLPRPPRLAAVVVLTVASRSPNVAEKHVLRHPGGRVAARRTSRRPTESKRPPAGVKLESSGRGDFNEQQPCRDRLRADELDLRERQSVWLMRRKSVWQKCERKSGDFKMESDLTKRYVKN